MPSFLSLRAPYALVGVIALFGWVFFFFRSESFEVKGIEITSSGGMIDAADVLPTVFAALDEQSARPWSKRQRFFLPKEVIEEGIKTALYAERVEVGEVQDNILRLNVFFGSRFVYTTQDGSTFLKCAVARPGGIPLEDPSVLNAVKKRYLTSKDFTTHGLDGIVYLRNTSTTLEAPVIKQLLELGRSLDDHKIVFAHMEEREGQEIGIQLDKDRELIMDLGQSILSQVGRAHTILRDKEYKDLKPVTIDLRIQGRAYLR